MIGYPACYCKEYYLIENFDEALRSSEKYVVHHRLETHFSDGSPRTVAISADELKALNMYFDRPPEELIFMTVKDHNRLHIKYRKNLKGHKAWNKGLKCKPWSEERKLKHKDYIDSLSNDEKKQKFGHVVTDESRQKNRKAHLGKKDSEEVRMKKSLAHKGIVFSEEHRRKLSEAAKRREQSKKANQQLASLSGQGGFDFAG